MTRDQAEACSECDKIRLEKELAATEAVLAHQRARVAALEDAELELDKAQWTADAENAKLLHTTIAEAAKGSIDRSRDSAKYVQTAAAAIATLYTGLLALVFSVTDNPLPLRGVWAAVFLGLAVALATAYLAFLTRPPAPSMYGGGGSLQELQLKRMGYLTRWVNATVRDRIWSIRAAVLSLGIGVAFIAAPFITSNRSAAIPAAPTPPTIPAKIADSVVSPAAKLFDDQVAAYTAAVNARNEAIKNAATSAQSEPDSDVETAALLLALIGLLVVFLGPGAYDAIQARSAAGGEVEAGDEGGARSRPSRIRNDDQASSASSSAGSVTGR